MPGPLSFRAAEVGWDEPDLAGALRRPDMHEHLIFSYASEPGKGPSGRIGLKEFEAGVSAVAGPA